MKCLGNYFGLAFIAALIFSFVGCSTLSRNNPADSATSFASPTELSAALTNGNNVVLHWKNNSTVDGGNWIEYTTPGYDWIQLDAFASDENTTQFFHTDLAPDSTFIYRILPFFGQPTETVAITTGIASSNDVVLPDGPIASTNEIPSNKNVPKFSVRSMQTFAKAAPTDLTATLSSPTSIDLRWQDHSSDEDGYLLEISAHNDGDFAPCALLPPNATSFRKTSLPPQTKCYFRVRAFFYGKPSDSASVKTMPP